MQKDLGVLSQLKVCQDHRLEKFKNIYCKDRIFLNSAILFQYPLGCQQ
jgi:hypothetical protein